MQYPYEYEGWIEFDGTSDTVDLNRCQPGEDEDEEDDIEIEEFEEHPCNSIFHEQRLTTADSEVLSKLPYIGFPRVRM